MKKLLFLMLLLAAAGYFIWPYSVSWNVRDAINSSDEGGLEKVADWASVRLSVRDQLKPLADEAMRKRYAANLPQVLKMVSTDELLNKVIEEEVNAKGLIRNTKGKMEFSEAKQIGIESRSWAGFSGFDMKFTGSEASYHFDFKGTDGWKLVTEKLGPKDSDAYLVKFNDAVTERIKKVQAAAGIKEPGKTESWVKEYHSPLDQPAKVKKEEYHSPLDQPAKSSEGRPGSGRR
jgi:Protein of unknown function (DUF2939)